MNKQFRQFQMALSKVYKTNRKGSWSNGWRVAEYYRKGDISEGCIKLRSKYWEWNSHVLIWTKHVSGKFSSGEARQSFCLKSKEIPLGVFKVEKCNDMICDLKKSVFNQWRFCVGHRRKFYKCFVHLLGAYLFPQVIQNLFTNHCIKSLQTFAFSPRFWKPIPFLSY